MATAVEHERGEERDSRLWLALTVGLFLLGLAAYFAIWEWLAHDSAHWPRTQGVVTGHGSRNLGMRRTGSRPSRFDAIVFYDYTVDGSLYHGERLAVHVPQEYTSTTHQGAVSTGGMRFPDASIVDVYYHPTFPSIAILVRTPADWTGPLLAAAPVALFVLIYSVGRFRPGDEPK